MSAYVVDRRHIRFLVAAMRHHSPKYPGDGHQFTWRYDGQRRRFDAIARKPYPVASDCRSEANVGQLLWDENVKSVSHRYPGAESLRRAATDGEVS